jgi:hypothetical protein
MHPQLLTIIIRVAARDIMGWWNQRNAQHVQKQKRNVKEPEKHSGSRCNSID